MMACPIGAAAGVLSWAVVYPVDVIKSVVQIQPLTAPPEQRSVWGTIRRLYAKEGLAVFWRGLGVTLLRAFPVNGIVFPTYEMTVSTLQGLGLQKKNTNVQRMPL